MKIVGKISSVQFLDKASKLRVSNDGKFHDIVIDDFLRENLPFNLCMNTTFVFEVANDHVIGVEKV